jgi:glycosyltransferase involved in cell wall biosynthesis
MKILWVTTNFLHPTTRGGQIRTLEMLRRLHRRHEIHFVAIEDPLNPEGLARAPEYSTRAYPFQYKIADKRSPAFVLELAKSVLDPEPLSIRRFHPPAMGAFLARLIERERFDREVCDFLTPASYFPDIERAVLFQHNVETMIWRRHAEHAGNPAVRWYMRKQADRMFRFERGICRSAGHIAAVSGRDAATMRELFGVERVSAIPTGVDIEFFTPPDPPPTVDADLAFVGAMDWRPNIDGVRWFVREALPLIRRIRPDCSLTIVGRTPPPSVAALAREDPRIRVTGTVADIRPHLWRSAVSIVPLRIGGGTRLKIYESMAGRVPVVSTSVGAEGLEIHPPEDIRIADSPADFAAACLELLSDASLRRRQAAAAWEMVAASFSWEQVARCFERVLEMAVPAPAKRGRAAGGS